MDYHLASARKISTHKTGDAVFNMFTSQLVTCWQNVGRIQYLNYFQKSTKCSHHWGGNLPQSKDLKKKKRKWSIIYCLIATALHSWFANHAELKDWSNHFFLCRQHALYQNRACQTPEKSGLYGFIHKPRDNLLYLKKAPHESNVE